MTIYFNPDTKPNPDTITIYQDSSELGTIDISDVSGMPDTIGGVAPDAVREFVADELAISLTEAAYHTDYEMGQP